MFDEDFDMYQRPVRATRPLNSSGSPPVDVRQGVPTRTWQRPVRWAGIAVLLLAVGVQLGTLVEPLMLRWTVEPRPVTARGELARDEQSTIEIFQRVSPSVVYLTTTRRVVHPWTQTELEGPRGTGSGFVWDEHGHIVTNYHVVAGAKAADVQLSDDRVYRAVLVGASSEHDLAVLRIDVPIGLPPPVPLGTSHDLKVGQKVFAIGNPFGLDRSLTTGIISAVDRSLRIGPRNTLANAIQTDAAINPGNSGGPLIDSAGRLIGINTAIYSPSGAHAGVGFAVPVDTVNRIVPELIVYGERRQPSRRASAV